MEICDAYILHSQKKQLTQQYIFILASLELSLYSWIACLDDDVQLSELFLLRVYVSVEGGQNFSARTSRGADFQRADVEGGHNFSAPESENSSAPLVAVNNERSLYLGKAKSCFNHLKKRHRIQLEIKWQKWTKYL